MMGDHLNDDNFLDYCYECYDEKLRASTKEFLEDIKRIKYIKKLITRYESGNKLRERLILNHIIVLNNVFGPVATCRILYFHMKERFHLIKPFLVFLNIMQDKLYKIDGEEEIITDYIPMDFGIVEVLRKI